MPSSQVPVSKSGAELLPLHLKSSRRQQNGQGTWESGRSLDKLHGQSAPCSEALPGVWAPAGPPRGDAGCAHDCVTWGRPNRLCKLGGFEQQEGTVSWMPDGWRPGVSQLRVFPGALRENPRPTPASVHCDLNSPALNYTCEDSISQKGHRHRYQDLSASFQGGHKRSDPSPG